MDLSYSAEQLAFRETVRTFLRDKLPERLSQKVASGKRLTKQDFEEWHAILNQQGWLGVNWPTEHGNSGNFS